MFEFTDYELVLLSKPPDLVVPVADLQAYVREAWTEEEPLAVQAIELAQEQVMEFADLSLLQPTQWRLIVKSQSLVGDAPYRLPRPPVVSLDSAKVWIDAETSQDLVVGTDVVLVQPGAVVFKNLPTANVLRGEELPVVAELTYTAGHSSVASLHSAIVHAVRELAATHLLRMNMDPKTMHVPERMLHNVLARLRQEIR